MKSKMKRIITFIVTAATFTSIAYADITEKQEQEIRGLIEQLVFAHGEASNNPVIHPDMHPNGEDYRRRFETCQKAFQKLSEFKDIAFPFLIEHFEDKRQSINFRNHYLGNSVGNACYWIIYFQLQDRPSDYSEYGYQRKGRDGEYHTKPYWEGTPFDSEGGIKQWLEKNKDLSYTQMQIKCLDWLLEKEKSIGADDAESYFINILPLEIRIFERKLEAGENVEQELNRLRRIKNKKLAEEIPSELLPEN